METTGADSHVNAQILVIAGAAIAVTLIGILIWTLLPESDRPSASLEKSLARSEAQKASLGRRNSLDNPDQYMRGGKSPASTDPERIKELAAQGSTFAGITGGADSERGASVSFHAGPGGKYYARTDLEKEFPRSVVFDFPNNFDMGLIDYCTDYIAEGEFPRAVREAAELKLAHAFQAQGRLVFEKGAPLEYTGKNLDGTLSALEGFRAQDLYKVTLIDCDLRAETATRALTALSGLRQVALDRASFTRASLQALSRLPALKALHIRHPINSNLNFADLPYFKKLFALTLPAESDFASLCESLEGSKTLENLAIDGLVPAEQLRHLQGLALRDLTLRNNSMTADKLNEIAAIKSLKSLHLVNCTVDNAGLKDYAVLKHVKQLDFYQPEGMHASGAEFVRKLLPSARVSFIPVDYSQKNANMH